MTEKDRPELIQVPVPPAAVSMNPASSSNLFSSYPMSYPSAQASFERGSLGSVATQSVGIPTGPPQPPQSLQGQAQNSSANQAMYDPVRSSDTGAATFVSIFDDTQQQQNGHTLSQTTSHESQAQKRKRTDQERLMDIAPASPNGINNNNGNANQFVPHYSQQGAPSPQDEHMTGTKPEGPNAQQKTHVCDHCQARFTRLHNLKSHLLTHTSSKKDFTCSDCGSEFRRLHDLKRHQKLHTGEKPFACDLCGRRFARADALGRHTKSASAEGGCANTPRKSKSEPGSLHASHGIHHDALQAIANAGSQSTPNPLRSLTQIDTSFAPRDEFLREQEQQDATTTTTHVQPAVHALQQAFTTTSGRRGPHFNNDHILEAQIVTSPGGLSPQDDMASRYEQLLQQHQALQRSYTEATERLRQYEDASTMKQ